VLVVLALLAGGAFLLLGGDDGEEEEARIEREEDEEEDETTTTTEAEETTTTTEAEAEETTTTEAEDGAEQQFDQVTDDTGLLVVEIPVEWTDRETAPQGTQPAIVASTDLATARRDFTVPSMGLVVVSNTPADHDAVLDAAAALANLNNACTPGEREDYDDNVFTGRIQVFTGCGGIDTTVIEIAGNNAAGLSITVSIQLTVADPPEIADRIIETFNTTS